MVLPAAPCDTGPEPCCVSLNDIAQHLLSEAFDALNSCCSGSCEHEVIAYVTVGGGDDGITDALTVAISSVGASVNTRGGGPGLYRAVFEVRLKESGWPTVQVSGDEIALPDPIAQQSAARHLYAHGEAIHRRLAALSTSRGLVPVGTPCANGQVGSLSPLPPQGGVVGWIMPVTVDLAWS